MENFNTNNPETKNLLSKRGLMWCLRANAAKSDGRKKSQEDIKFLNGNDQEFNNYSNISPVNVVLLVND